MGLNSVSLYWLTNQWASGVEEVSSSLTQLMGKLLTHYGGGRTEPRQYRHCEWGADSQTINEVMQRVAQSYHPRHRLDAGDLLPTQPVTHDARHLDILEEFTELNGL